MSMYLKMSVEEFDKHVTDRYPTLLRERKGNSTPLGQRGYEINPGWRHLVGRTLDLLHSIEQISGCEIVIKQIKEKFASLVIYYGIDPKSVEKLSKEQQLALGVLVQSIVIDASNASEHVCEDCANTSGSAQANIVRIGYRMVTLCPSCAGKAVLKYLSSGMPPGNLDQYVQDAGSALKDWLVIAELVASISEKSICKDHLVEMEKAKDALLAIGERLAAVTASDAAKHLQDKPFLHENDGAPAQN